MKPLPAVVASAVSWLAVMVETPEYIASPVLASVRAGLPNAPATEASAAPSAPAITARRLWRAAGSNADMAKRLRGLAERDWVAPDHTEAAGSGSDGGAGSSQRGCSANQSGVVNAHSTRGS